MKTTLNTVFIILLSFGLLVGFNGCDSSSSYDMSEIDNDALDAEDFREYISQAKQSAANESFSSANEYLEKASKLGVSRSELSYTKLYIAQKKKAYEDRLERERLERERIAREQRERERQEQLARENSQRNQQESSERQDRFCYSLNTQSQRDACLGNAYATKSSNARYIILGNCYAMEGSDKTALMQVCLNGKQGCYSFSNSDVMNACVRCEGSNRWLRTYAAGSLFNCY